MVPGTMLGAFTCSMSPKAQNKPVFNGGYFSIYTRVKPGSKKMHEDWPRSHGQEEAEAAMGAQSHALSIALHGMGQESIKHRGQTPRSTCDAGVIHPLSDNLQMLISYPTHNQGLIGHGGAQGFTSFVPHSVTSTCQTPWVAASHSPTS